MTYGGKHSWIDLSHRKEPDTSWFIFVGSKPDDIREGWERIEDKIITLQALQKNFPEQEKIRYDYLEISFQNDLVELIRYFRALFNLVTGKGYLIACNLTAGLFETRMALYLAAQVEQALVFEVFYLNKQSFQKNIIFKNINITQRGKDLLSIMHAHFKEDQDDKEKKEFSLSKLHQITKETKNKHILDVDLPSLSRLVNDLVKEGYITERREGREKLLSISELGFIFCPVDRQLQALKDQLKASD